jgi:Zn-dependent peptidase ImmA (M78 family)
MPVEEARGFSIIEDGCAAIIVNGRDSVRARIFTILHEYAHILLNEHAVCNDESGTSSDLHAASIERWCNMFAGAFLLPKDDLERNDRICQHIAEHQYEKAVDKIASHFKVSKEAALIRLRALDIISETELLEIRSKIPSHVVSPKEKNFKPSSKEEICLRENGEWFVSLVLKCENLGQITYYDALDYLDIKSFDLLKSRMAQA